RCRGSGPEPSDPAVDHVEVGWRCTCPSPRPPSKHALALLQPWVRGGVAPGARPAGTDAWLAARDRRAAGSGATGTGTAGAVDERPSDGDADHDDEPPQDRGDLDRSRDDRVARMMEGLTEL